jgi:hypothetical protein
LKALQEEIFNQDKKKCYFSVFKSSSIICRSLVGRVQIIVGADIGGGLFGLNKSLIASWIPVHGITGMPEKIRTFLINQAIRFHYVKYNDACIF